ncbi:hypothetical protein PCC7424_0136 [Gloeothece citriformis PCC 7424]|uniref:Uncharacterized protein n=1 Tax=Gloeothece citriformis (strain PCC 7424) TaxID=65393 RepID=B7K9C3_GLOC7|nr:hypothetical protein [Gloeothece citriformis]ACK68606.1 hypothetical protein PCC7424_0136 [Gloeothece citriformis PCC 7424]
MPTPLSAFSGITIDYSDVNNPILKIPFSAVAGIVGRDTVPTAANDGGLDWWIVALLQGYADLPANEEYNILIGTPQPLTPTTRNGISNRVNYRYLVTVYTNQTVTNEIDGDNV